MNRREPLTVKPIGVIHTPFQNPEDCPAQGAFSDAEGSLEVDQKYQEALADLEGFSHIWLVFWFHECGPYEAKVIPLLDHSPRGLFSTRHPNRPNPIGITAVEIVEISGREIIFRGADMLDGSPLLDIKPMAPGFDHRRTSRLGWLEKVLNQAGSKERFRSKKL